MPRYTVIRLQVNIYLKIRGAPKDLVTTIKDHDPFSRFLQGSILEKTILKDFFAVQNLKMALKKANILQHTKSFFV